MKIKILMISIFTFLLTITCLLFLNNTASAMVMYDSWDDLNGKQFYLELENFNNVDTFIVNRDAINYRNVFYKNSKHFGKIDIYNENDELLDTVEEINYGEFGLSQYKLFYYSYHGEMQMDCLSVYDNNGNLNQFFGVDYIVWTVPENAFGWEKELGQSSDVYCGSNDWNDLYGDISLVSRCLSENGQYSYDKAYSEGNAVGYKEGQIFGYNAGISANISNNAEKVYVDNTGKTETENALKVLIAVSSTLVLVATGFLIVLGIKNKMNKTNNTKVKVSKRRKRIFRR